MTAAEIGPAAAGEVMGLPQRPGPAGAAMVEAFLWVLGLVL